MVAIFSLKRDYILVVVYIANMQRSSTSIECERTRGWGWELISGVDSASVICAHGCKSTPKCQMPDK